MTYPSRCFAIIVLLVLSTCLSSAWARRQYLRHVPSPFGCTTCHGDPAVDPQGPAFRNGFGIDYVFQRQDWSQLCDLDSDGDGISNAIELLDPDCLWRPRANGQQNTPLPMGEATHPGDPEDPNQCGDGQIQGREACDGTDLGAQTCETLGYMSGQLSCAENCTFNESACVVFPTQSDMDVMQTDMMFDQDQQLVDAQVADQGVQDADVSAYDMRLEQTDATQAVGLQDYRLEADGFNTEDNSIAPDSMNADLSTPLDHSVDAALDASSSSAPPVSNANQTGCAHAPTRSDYGLSLLLVVCLCTRRKGARLIQDWSQSSRRG